MIRRKFLQKVVTCATIACSIFVHSAVVADEKVRLRFQTFYGTEMDSVTKQFVKNVKEWSDGVIRIQLFRGGELISTDQLLDAVSNGTVDMVHGTGAYWASKVDMGNLEMGMPGAWTSLEEAKDLFQNKGIGDLLDIAYEEQGVHYITTGFGGRYDLLTTEPINSLDDLKNMKIRAATQVSKTLKKLDIPSVFLPAQELYVGLSTGVIDGVIYGGPFDYQALKLFETAKHYTSLNMQYPGWTETYLFNQKKWDSLSKSHQDVLTRATLQMAEDLNQVLEVGDQEAIAKGIFVMNSISAEDSARLTSAAQDVWDEEAARSERNAKAVAIIRENAKEQGRL